MLDVGDAGRQSDVGVYKSSNLGYAINHNTINRPPTSSINGSVKEYPYVFVADDTFQLKPYMIKPFARLDSSTSKKYSIIVCQGLGD